jgi:hypothetical protein
MLQVQLGLFRGALSPSGQLLKKECLCEHAPGTAGAVQGDTVPLRATPKGIVVKLLGVLFVDK